MQHPDQPIPQNPLLLVLPSTVMVTAPSYASSRASCPAKTLPANVVDIKATGDPNARVDGASQQQKSELAREPRGCHSNWLGRGQKHNKTDAVDVGDDYEPWCYEVGVAGMAFCTPSHAKWLTSDHHHVRDTWVCHHHRSQHRCDDQSVCNCANVWPNGTKPTWVLRCKVDMCAHGNVMVLHIFAKLFPRCISTDGKPLGLHPANTYLAVYNGSSIFQLRNLDTAIEWKPEGHNLPN